MRHGQLLVLFLLTIYSISIFGCKEYNQFDFGIDYLVMFTCRVVSCVFGRECLLWLVCSLGKTLLAFALFDFVLQGQTCLLLQVSLDFLILHSSPLWWKGHLLLVFIIEGCVDHHRTVQLQLFSITAQGIDLDYCDIECPSLEMNRESKRVPEKYLCLLYWLLQSLLTVQIMTNCGKFLKRWEYQTTLPEKPVCKSIGNSYN